jgi:sugar/nucleoside kinase (ribokinase family)
LTGEPAFDFLVIGDCNPDLVLNGENVAPMFGQVERVVDNAELMIGGSGAITACGAARLGLRTALVGLVGDDALGRFMLDALMQRGVDVSSVVVDRRLATGVSVVLVREEDRATLTALGSISALSGDRIEQGLLRSARHVHVSSFFLQHALHRDLPSMLRRARLAGATTSLDPNWDPAEAWNGGFLAALAETHVLLLNAKEALRISGAAGVEQAALTLARNGVTVVVKRGREGALAAEGDHLVYAPALTVDTVDSVGAGDSFNAGFIAGLLEGRPLEDTLALANACGALSMRAAGGTASQPTRAEVSVR